MMQRDNGRNGHLRWLFFPLLLCLLASAVVWPRQPQNSGHPVHGTSKAITVVLDPSKTAIHWTLPSTLHTVHGTFALKHGQLQFDPATGKAAGEIVVDARSGQSGNSSRDAKMHHDVLQSTNYPEISFRPLAFSGTLPSEGKANLEIKGVFTLHGADHPFSLPIQADFSGANWKASCAFTIPYVSWGLKNPSNFFLKVRKEVQIEIDSSGTVSFPDNQ